MWPELRVGSFINYGIVCVFKVQDVAGAAPAVVVPVRKEVGVMVEVVVELAVTKKMCMGRKKIEEAVAIVQQNMQESIPGEIENLEREAMTMQESHKLVAVEWQAVVPKEKVKKGRWTARMCGN